MENLMFSLNATVPVFAMMVLGYLFGRLGIMTADFADKLNRFVFLIPLPVLLFRDLSKEDFFSAWDGTYVLFCFAASLVSILAAAGISLLIRERGVRGEFTQSAYRSSCALLGVSFVENIYGQAGAASLMILGAVPLYNVAAVVVLTFLGKENPRGDRKLVGRTLRGVVTNPIILGIVAGLLWSVLRLPQPPVLEKTVSSVAALASPLGLMALGASFDPRQTSAQMGRAALCALMKLVLFPAAFLPLAVALGFRGEKLVAALVMLGAATTVSCYTMARSMGHRGDLTAGAVMLTTLLSAFTLTGWLWLLRMGGYV